MKTSLKNQLIKGIKKMKMFQDYNAFNIESFHKDLKEFLKNHTTYDYSYFQNVFMKLLYCTNKDKNTSL